MYDIYELELILMIETNVLKNLFSSPEGVNMEWINASTVKISADHRTMLQESSNIWFFPVYYIECDGKPSAYSFHTVMRWENKTLIKGKMTARAAMSGLSLNKSKSGSWPFIDLHLKKGNDDEPVMKISDQNMLLHSKVILPGYWEAVYKSVSKNGKSDVIKCTGRDVWQTSSDREEKNSAGDKHEGARLKFQLLGTIVNFIHFLLPATVKKGMPADISDFIKLKYDFLYRGVKAAAIKTDAKPFMKSLEISFIPEADENARNSAMAHAAVLLHYLARKIPAPEIAVRSAAKGIKNSVSI